VAQSAIQSWYRGEASVVSLSLGGEVIPIERADVDRLVRSLRQSVLPGAASISEEISARMLTGHVTLCPSEAELDVLVATLERLGRITDERSALRRLLAVGVALRDREGLPTSGGREGGT
jgi:hypothetical protein